MGQIEGAFVQGIWFFMLEEYKTNSDGLVTADSTWRYKVPTIDNIPKQFNVEILSSGHHQNRVLSSKGIPSSVTVGLEEHSSVPFCEAGTEEDHGKPGDKNKMKHVMDSGIMTRSKELEKDVSPVKKARTEVSVIPPSTPGSNMIVLDGESREMTETKFRLPHAVNYSEEEIKLAHYIFAADLPLKEVLVDTMMKSYTRKVLWSLCPNSNVDADVITAMTSHLTLDEISRDAGRGRRVCFLPTELQEMVLNYGMTPKKALECYGTKFLTTAHTCRKLCLPMNDMMHGDGIHWYLVVILMDDKQVHILDSYPSKERQTTRKDAVQTMIGFLDALFEDLYLQVEQMCDPPVMKEFSLTIPSVPEQRHQYDSGIWVCVWMLGATWDEDYFIWPCGDMRRMQVALYLVKQPANYIRHVVIKEANRNAPRFELETRTYKEENRKRLNKN